MAYKNKILKGDTVVVIAGDEKGKKGEVMKVYPKIQKILIKGINLLKKHVKKTENIDSSILFKEGMVHISNVAFWDNTTDNIAKIKFDFTENGKKVRVIKQKISK